MTSFADRTTAETARRGYFDAEDVIMSVDIVAKIGGVVNLKKSSRDEYRGLCPFHTDRNPSFVVVPKMGKNGLWRCYGCGDGKWKDVIDFFRQAKGWDFRSACQHLVGDKAIEMMDADRERLKAAAAAQKKKDDLEAEQKRKTAYAHWNEARQIDGSPAEQYLRSRNITGPLPRTLRYLPGLWCKEARQEMPAMVAAMVDANGTFMALHRTWLARGTDRVWKKAALDNPKKALGRSGGAAVRLHPPAGGDVTAGATLYVAEGIETALSVLAGLRRRPHLTRNSAVWAATSLPNLSRLILPNEDTGLMSTCVFATVVLCVDADSAESGVRAEEITALHNYGARGCEVKVAWPAPGMDFNDMLKAAAPDGDGAAEIAAFVENVGEWRTPPDQQRAAE